MSETPRTLARDNSLPRARAGLPVFTRLCLVFVSLLRHRAFVWHTRDHKTRAMFWTLAGLFTLLAAGEYFTLVRVMADHGAAYVNSVFLFWGWSKFLHVISPASLIYDAHALGAFGHGLIGAPRIDHPFAYPPPALLLIWPLALVPPVAALLLWLGTSLAGYLWACWHRPWGLVALLGVVAPSTLAAIFAAQTSLLDAALIVGGCRLVGRRPVLAGVLFGVAAFKPQFGLLLPVALISSREWRCMVAAAATVLLTAVASGAAFGWATWIRLPAALAGLSAVVAQRARYAHLCPTLTSGLHMLGAGPTPAAIAQLAAALGVAAAIWLGFRRGFAPLPTAALLVGAFFVTPYAFYYDLPMVSYAVLAVVIERHRSSAAFRTWELPILILAVALPLLMLFDVARVPWGIVVLPLLFWLILRRMAVINHVAHACLA